MTQLLFSKYDAFNHRNNIYSLVASFTLVFYVSTEIVFRYTTVLFSYPGLAVLSGCCENIAMASAVMAIAIKPSKLSGLQFFLAFALLVILSISAFITGNYLLAQSALVVIAISGISIDKLAKMYGFTTILLIVLVVTLSLLGLLFNKDAIPNTRLVFSYGFGFPNTFGALLVSSVLAIAYAFWEKKLWILAFVLAIASAVFSYISLSCHAAAVLLALESVAMVVGHTSIIAAVDRRLPMRLYRSILFAVPIVLFGIMALCAFCYDADNGLFQWLDGVLHSRPFYSHEYYSQHSGLNLFGQKYVVANWHNTGIPFQAVDSGYSYLILVFGLLPTFACFLVYALAIEKLRCSCKSHFCVMAVFILYALYLVIETHGLYLHCSFAVLMVASAFSSSVEN